VSAHVWLLAPLLYAHSTCLSTANLAPCRRFTQLCSLSLIL